MTKSQKLITLALFLFCVPFYLHQFHSNTILCEDETCAVGLTYHPSMIGYDSYPLGWISVLRLARAVGTGDTWFRFVGLMVQLGIWAALYGYSRTVKCVPAITAAAFMLIPATINWTCTVRAWGFGILTLIVLYDFTERYLDNRSRWWQLCLAAVVAAQSTYYNCIALFCIFVTAMLWFKDKRPGLLLAGVLSALTMLPYLPAMLNENRLYHDLKVDFTINHYVQKLAETCNFGSCGSVWLVILTVMLVALLPAWRTVAVNPNIKWELSLLALMPVVYFAFLHHLAYATSVWYYLPLVCVVCLTLDKLVQGTIILVLCALVLLLNASAAWRASAFAQSNNRPVTDYLRANVRPEDWVVVAPWEAGEQINYYLTNRCHTLVIPETFDLREQYVTRHDEEQRFMAAWAEPNIDFARYTLDNQIYQKHRVFLVSNIDWSRKQGPAPTVPELMRALPNRTKSFYWSVIMNAQLANYIQGCVTNAALLNNGAYDRLNVLVIN